MADWLVVLAEATVRGSVLIAVAALAAWLLRRRAAAVRSVVWQVVACAIVALPMLSETVPRWRFDVPEVVSTSRIAIVSRLHERAGALVAEPTRGDGGSAQDERASPAIQAEARTGEANDVGWTPWLIVALFAVWATGALVAIGQLVLSLYRLGLIERRSRPVDAGDLGAHVGVLAEISVPSRVRVLEGPARMAPMTWGVLRPRVLIPAGWDRWPTPVAAAVLAHELAHVRRHDLARQLPWDVACVLFWFNPLVAVAAGQARLECEQACDDEVVEHGFSPIRYADALVALARELRGTGMARVPALGGGGAGELTKRIAAMLDPSRARRASRPAAFAAASLLAIVSVVAASASFAAKAEIDATIEGEVGRALDSAFTALAGRGLSGSVLVATHRGVVFAKGYGFADRSRRIPAAATTRYHVAGITKAFTATAVVDLIDRRLVSADAPVARYLPELRGHAGEVTVHQLLTHTDGLGHPGPVSRNAGAAAFLEALGRTPRAFAPGSDYQSTDVGHSVLAALVERVAGQSFDAYLRRRFIEPAGMAHTSLRLGREWRDEPIAVGYVGGGATEAEPGVDSWGVRGSRGLVTTVHDLHRWYTALASGRLVRQSALDLMFEPYWRTEKPFEQGYGWLLYDGTAVLPFRGTPIPVRRRSGREPGFEAEMVHDPNGGWFAAALLNADNGRRLDAIAAIRAIMNANPPPVAASR